EAVRHAMAAGETGWAARLVEWHVETLYRRGEGATLDRWLSAQPAAAVRARPRLCLAQAAAAIWRGRLEAGGPLVGSGGGGFAASGRGAAGAAGGRGVGRVGHRPRGDGRRSGLGGVLRGDPARAVDCARQALAHLGEEDGLVRFAATLHLAV